MNKNQEKKYYETLEKISKHLMQAIENSASGADPTIFCTLPALVETQMKVSETLRLKPRD